MTEGGLSDALNLIARHPVWSLVVAFSGAILQAIPVLGTFLPATLAMMGVAGAAAALGQPMLPFVAVSVVGAIIGEYFSYWLGVRYRHSIRQWWPLAGRPHLMAAADRFFDRYGPYSIALCRFIPVLRSTVPVAAGVAGMPFRRFMIANVVSAFVWAPVHVCPAQLAGLSIDELRAGNWEAAAYLGAGLLACCVAVWWVHRRLNPATARR